jgi:hypothetical protein
MTAATGQAYPASLTIDSPEKIANWRPLVHWLLAIPHLFVASVLNSVAEIVGLVSWVMILFTGKDNEGLQGMRMMSMRYQARTFAYVGFLVEDYPPFAFHQGGADPGDYPGVRAELTPVVEGRNRLTAFFRILMVLPHLVVLVLLGVAAVVCYLVAFFAVLFTGRWPDGLRTFVVNVMRWSFRVNAYLMLLNDEYPPFTLD